MTDRLYRRDVAIGDKASILPIMPRWEGEDSVDEPYEVLGFARKDDVAARVKAVVERPDANGVTCRDKTLARCVIDNAGKLSVEQCEEVGAVLAPEREQDFAIAVAREGVALRAKIVAHALKAIQLPVAYRIASAQLKRLHA